MMNQKALFATVIVAAALQAGCSKLPSCSDPDTLKQITDFAQKASRDQITTSFSTPFLTKEASAALVAFFAADGISLADMRRVSVDKELGVAHCAASATYAYAMEGRVEKAKKVLEHGSVSNQNMAYMLDGLPYSAAVAKMGPALKTDITYLVQKTDDGHLHAELADFQFPLFSK